MEKQEKVKTCEDCKYFFAYYIRKDGYYSRMIHKGHCGNKMKNGRSRKTDKICECFTETSKDEKKEEEEKTIKIYLKRIDWCLEELIKYLERSYILPFTTED